MYYWKLDLCKLQYGVTGNFIEKKTFLKNFKTQKLLTDFIEKEIIKMRKKGRRNMRVSIIYCENKHFPTRIRYVVSNFCVFDAHKIFTHQDIIF